MHDSQSHSKAQVDSVSEHVSSDAIVVPDAHLLFSGDFKRSGVDLILSGDDRELVLQNYFKGEKRAALSSPDGARLSGDLVNALTGHVEYAQAAGAPDAAKIIGHVTKLTGSATAIRNGVSIILNQGDNVAKGDVVQAGSDSQLGITFIDGTVFGLSSNARMVLNEMVYDPNGSNNSSLLSLVAGTISFVAGETAKHGDMKVNTPVATLGIRGTAVLVEIDFDVPAQGGTPPVKFQVLVERDGHTGSYVLYSLADPTVVIGTVNQAGQVTSVTGPGQVSTSPAPPLSPAAVAIIGPVFEQFFQNASPNNADPKSNSPPAGSTPPNPPPAAKPGDTSPINNLPVGAPTTVPIPINFQAPPTPGNPDPVQTVLVPVPVTITVLKTVDVTPAVDQTSFQIADHVTISDSQPSDTLVPFVPGHGTILSAVGPAGAPANLASFVSIDQQTGTVHASFAFLKPGEKVTVTVGFDTSAGTDTFHETLVLTIDGKAAIHWTNPNGGDFADTANWGGGVVPVATDNVAIDAAGNNYTVTSTADETVNSLAVASGVTLDVTGGIFTILNGTNAGGNAGTIEVDSGGQVVLMGDTINTGTLEATGGALQFEDSVITNTGGTITVSNGSTLTLFDATIDGGTINDFSLSISSGTILPGDIDVTGSSTINGGAVLSNGDVTIEANQTLTLSGVTISGSTLSLESGSTLAIEYDTNGSGATLDGVTVNNSGNVQVDNPLAATTTLTLDDGATISGGALHIGGSGEVYVQNNGALFGATLDGVAVTNEGSIEIGTPTAGSTLILEGGTTISGGMLTLREAGDVIDVETNGGGGPDATLDGVTVENPGTIEIGLASGAILALDGGTIVTGGGTLTVMSGTLTLNDATLDGGTIQSGFQSIDVTGSSTIDGGATLNGGGDLTVEGNQTLTLNDVTICNVGIDLMASGSVISGDIDVTGSSEFINVSLNKGVLTVEAGQTLTLDDVTTSAIQIDDTAGGAVLQIDGNNLLLLTHTTISGGTINAFSVITGSVTAGDIAVSGGLSTINDGALLNNGVVTVDFGATLTLDNVTANGTSFTDTASGAILQIDGGDTLTLNGVTIDGGTINDFTAIPSGPIIPGDIDVTGSSTINGGAVLNHGNVAVASGVTLTLDNVSAIGASFADTASGAILQIDGDDTLVLVDTTISGGAIDAFSLGTSGSIIAGDIDVTGSSTINNGAVLNNGAVMVAGGVTLTLDNVTVNGTSFTDTASGAILQIDGNDTLTSGTTITGGTLTIGSLGMLDITAGPQGIVGNGNPDATLDGVKVTNSGTIDVDPAASGAILMLDHGTTVTGGALHIGASGEVYVQDNGASFGATLNGVNVTNDGSLEIGTPTGGSTLILDGGTTISGGTLALLQVGDVLDVDVRANATLDGVKVVNNGTIEVVTNLNGTGASLTLDGGTTISDGALTVGPDSMLTLNDATISNSLINQFGAPSGSIDVTGSSTLNDGTVLNDSVVTVESHVTLTLDDVSTFGFTFFDTASGAALQVDVTHVLTLNETTIDGGTINDAGEIDIIGSPSTIANGAVINNGQVTVEGGATLTLDNVTANGVIFTGTGNINNVGTITIAQGGTVEFDTAVTGTTTFAGPTGTLILNPPSSFAGKIAGIVGSGDVLDLKGFDAAHDTVLASTGAGSFDSATDTTSLVVTDETISQSVTLKLVGDLSGSTWTVTADGQGGADIVDPPAVGAVAGHNPGPAPTQTNVASAPNQALTGSAASDNFVFNFTNVGRATVTDFHPATDTLQFNSSVFANAQDALNATHDDGHGNTVVTLDAHDAITLNSVLKAQLHATDFHIV